MLWQSLHSLMTTSKGQMNTLFPSLLAILNNMGPYITNLSVPACRKIHMLLVQMSSPRFLIANETNHLLLQSLLQFINAILEHQFDSKLTRPDSIPTRKKGGRTNQFRKFPRYQKTPTSSTRFYDQGNTTRTSVNSPSTMLQPSSNFSVRATTVSENQRSAVSTAPVPDSLTR